METIIQSKFTRILRLLMVLFTIHDWSGLSISHDPTFTLTTGDAAAAGAIDEESSEAPTEDGFAPGFEFLAVLLVLGSLPLLRARRNSSRKE